MKNVKIIFLLKLLLIFFNSCTFFNNENNFFKILDEKKINYSKQNLTVVIALDTECPLSIQYVEKINELARIYSEKVNFLIFFPGPYYSIKEIELFIKQNKIQIDFIHDIDFRVESDNKTHQIFSDAGNDLLVLGSDVEIPDGVGSDTNIIISGSQDGQGNVVFTGDVVISGSLHFTQKYVHTVKFTHTADANKKYVRWESNGVNSAPGVNNKWVAPADGRLSQVVIRSTHTPGNTNLGFHRASNGTENFSSSAVETQAVNLDTANTSAVVNFTNNASFSQGEVVGFSMHPTNVHGNVNISFIFELDFTN